MKKGFTLVELLAVIIILGVVVMISYPIVGNIIEDSKEKLEKEQIEFIKKGAKDWAYDNTDKLNNEVTIKLLDLKKGGYLPINIKNPKTNQIISNQTTITISNLNNQYEFNVTLKYYDNFSNTDNLSLNGENNIGIKKGDKYVEKGIIGSTPIDISNVDITYIYKPENAEEIEVSNIDTNKIGTYKVIYTYLNSSISRVVMVIN